MSISIAAFVWFGANTIFTARQLVTHQPSITSDNGAFYMLGIGIALGARIVAMVFEVWKK